MSGTLDRIKMAVVEGKDGDVRTMVQAAIDEGVSPYRIMEEALRAAMDIVGERYEDGRFYVPEMVFAASALKEGLAIIRPLLGGEGTTSQGRVVMATVHGDIHDIGKNLVIMMLEAAGFEIVDLGVDVSSSKIVRKVAKVKPDVLGMSALLSTSMHEMRSVINELEEKGLRKDVKVMVGGAPVDSAFAENVGADAYGRDAVEAVQLARAFMAQKGDS